MTSKDIVNKEENAYNLFSNRPPKDILAILDLQEERVYNKYKLSVDSNNDDIWKRRKNSKKTMMLKSFTVNLDSNGKVVENNNLEKEPSPIDQKQHFPNVDNKPFM